MNTDTIDSTQSDSKESRIKSDTQSNGNNLCLDKSSSLANAKPRFNLSIVKPIKLSEVASPHVKEILSATNLTLPSESKKLIKPAHVLTRLPVLQAL